MEAPGIGIKAEGMEEILPLGVRLLILCNQGYIVRIALYGRYPFVLSPILISLRSCDIPSSPGPVRQNAITIETRTRTRRFPGGSTARDPPADP